MCITAGNGVVSVSLYFADLMSDLQVVGLLYSTGNVVWARISCAILIVQFLVVYLRVLPYLHTTFGGDSAIYRTFFLLGFPWGCLLFDTLMILEPIGLLSVLPLPAWVPLFVPAYKATRIIAEVLIEALPQSLLQGFIYIVVVNSSKAGTATPQMLAMLDFVSVLPRSILISSLATLKTWVELVEGARAAGLTVVAKAVQLWNVGAGLPLDALKKGAIVQWACPYKLEEAEVCVLLRTGGGVERGVAGMVRMG